MAGDGGAESGYGAGERQEALSGVVHGVDDPAADIAPAAFGLLLVVSVVDGGLIVAGAEDLAVAGFDAALQQPGGVGVGGGVVCGKQLPLWPHEPATFPHWH